MRTAYTDRRQLRLGDVFRVAVGAGVVNYYKNGTVFYTSSVAPATALRPRS